ncbi:Glycosyltransferase [Rhodovastum atsumiense]|uniref:Glycosyltransferase n=1 Tax=Rhodovastum atsumiense TaxID=504468 RepID=A0A5M6IS40_9PROT|nr:glycosyltransferase [Rhodovastum atsumiense]KAA5610707.1 glycosyltransferase [Rhodovastum atsumiense]CAH2603291.1 Glycosyltransferase [Rhodovastum atsumiense]
MPALTRAVTRVLAGPYCRGVAAMTHRLLRGRSGPRAFDRVVVVAALGKNNGITSGARRQWATLRACGIEAELLDATPALRNPLFRIPHQPGSAYVFHSAGPQSGVLVGAVLPHVATAWRIGYWAWELPDPPPEWLGYERNFHEIWTPSGFSQASLARGLACPVEIVPHHIPARAARRRAEDAPFTVLVMADSRSSWERKNPEGALRAFRAAFGTSAAARLVLKLTGWPQDVLAFEQRFAGLLEGGNVEVVRGHLDAAALARLYCRADVLLSLHRAEGYGLPMAEAMAWGVPVVATGWSGNLDFMDDSDSCLVPYRLVPVSDSAAIYRGSTWAEPDLDAAAAALRRLAEDPAFHARLASAAFRRACAVTPRFPFPLPEAAPAPAMA